MWKNMYTHGDDLIKNIKKKQKINKSMRSVFFHDNNFTSSLSQCNHRVLIMLEACHRIVS